MRLVGVRPARAAPGRLEVVMMPQQGGVAAPLAPVQQPTGQRRNLAALERMMARLEGEFREMPGLHLTPAQASRLLSLEAGACTRVLRALVERGVLRTTATGHFVRRPSPR